MANSRKTAPKPATITQFPNPEGSIAVEDPPEVEPRTPFDSEPPPTTPIPPPKHAGGRPRKGEPQPESNFFAQVAAVPRDDWGTRVYLYLYVLEPVCNLKQSGGKAYLMRYEEPITDEHRVMMEEGSGRYRFVLAKNKTSPEHSNELARYEFEIYNPTYPPKVPREAWVNDPRNRRWAALLPPLPVAVPQSAATGISEFVEVLRATNEMRKEVREEVQASTSTPAPIATPPAATPATADPFDTVAKIMGMRSNDPMITLLLSRMEAQDKSMEQARQREYDLQKELRQSQTVQQTAAAPKTLLEQLKELGELKTLAGTLFGAATEAAPLRPGKLGYLDMIREIVPEIVNSKILNALADRIAAPAAQLNPSVPHPNGNGQPNLDETMAFVRIVVTPAMLQHFEREETGSEFAAWIFDGHPDRLAELQSFGEQRIFELYKQHAPRADWALLSSRGEQAFAVFVHQFCAWKPEPDEDEHTGSAAATNPANVIIDLDADDENGKGGDNS